MNSKRLKTLRPCGARITAALLIGTFAWTPLSFAQSTGDEGSNKAEAALADTPAFDEDAFFDRVEEGQEQFTAGNHEDALRLFREAYAMKAEPNLLFNIGLSLENLGRLDEALAHYEEFIDAPNVSLQARRLANERAQVIREILADRRRQEEEAARAAEERQREEEQARAAAEAPQIEEPPPEPPRPKVKRDYTWAWVTLGSGAAVAAAGGGFLFLANAAGDEVPLGPTADDRRASKEKAETYGLVSDSLFIAGGAIAASSLFFFLTAKPVEDTSAAVTLAPQIGPDRAGIQLNLRF